MSATPGRVEAGAHPPGGLAYEERGRGPAVLLVHGTALGAGVWRETRAALPDTVRALAYDRRGYGASGAPEPYGGTTVEEQAEDAAALLRALDAAPAVVCGFELGALVALDLLRRHAGLVAGAVLVEPPLLSLSAEGPEAVGTLREAIEAGAREGRAIEALLGALGGPGALARLGTDRVAGARAAPARPPPTWPPARDGASRDGSCALFPARSPWSPGAAARPSGVRWRVPWRERWGFTSWRPRRATSCPWRRRRSWPGPSWRS